MSKIKKGDVILLHYTGYRADNSIFDSTTARSPLKLRVGDELLIDGLENALLGMAKGEVKTVNVKAAEAYGELKEELLVEVLKHEVFQDIEVEVDQLIELPGDEGSSISLRVKEIKGDIIILDGNHELAGEDLSFDIEVIDILDEE